MRAHQHEQGRDQLKVSGVCMGAHVASAACRPAQLRVLLALVDCRRELGHDVPATRVHGMHAGMCPHGSAIQLLMVSVCLC